MSKANLEHVNLTVADPDHSAALLSRIFDWHIRWQGDAMNNGRTVHIGNEECYLALYSPQHLADDAHTASHFIGSLNHVALVVDDLDLIEQRVKKEGLEPFNFGHYEPGQRFYFLDLDGIEFEIVQY